ncbi:MAG: TldD/PmbA family protein [Chloroflexi bacterium]|nr:TldD/PmbA family protein [Chloroflexota bacterium]
MKQLRVQQYDPVVEALVAEAERLGVYVLGRIEDREQQSVVANNGRIERVDAGKIAGLGVQVFTRQGHSAFTSSDVVDEAEARRLVGLAARLARSAGSYDTEANDEVFRLVGEGRRVVATDFLPLRALSLEPQIERVLDVSRAVLDRGTGLAVHTAYGVVDDEWRVVRSDGTDLCFDQPRAFVQQQVTASRSGRAVTASGSVSGADATVLMDDGSRALLNARTARAADVAQQLLAVEAVPSGHYKLIIDYALAKGLAHEAFGHAAETDGMETSILGRDGKLAVGEMVAAPGVTITDGSILGDYAYQPFSATGVERQTVDIVRDGVLQAGLGDVFSARRAGTRASGADRVESFRSLPLPRMSNIRITVAGALPLETPFVDVTPEALRALLCENGLLREGEPTLYLAGYKGGQVNPKEGDFVFNCTAIYDFTRGVRLHRPAIFSGKVLSALRSISAGIGPLHLDAMGHCGKAGQSVPSSGGSHSFLVVESNPDVTIGGD